MSEMMSVGQYPGGSSNAEHHCKDCQMTFESAKSLEVHLRYHQENLMNQWGTQAQQEESNNNNSKAGNHNSHVGHSKRESVTAPADSSEPSSQPPSSSPSSVPQAQPPPPPGGAQSYNHFPTPMFNEPAHFMFNEQAYILPHHYSPTHDDSVNNGNYTRYHPYQHQQIFQADRANSVSSTSPRSPLHCDKCGNVFESANQLADHIRANHPNSPSGYQGQPQYQQLGGSPQQQQMHSSPPVNSQQPPPQSQSYDYSGAPGATVKIELKDQEEQAEILDLDSHKVQTHRYEEELIRHHHQQQQDIQMQLHQQQQAMQQRGAPHSVSSMLGWPAGQEYHPVLSPMGPMDNVSPISDQGAFMRSQIPIESPRHGGSPIITSTQTISGHPIPTAMLQQSTKSGSISNQSWKSNEARRPKTYNCTACNKWFTSSGHLKRHYNTTLHKNAVKQSNQPDPANMPISAHHHPGRDANPGHTGRGGPPRSPEISTGSPPNLMAGPLGEAPRGLLRTPTNLYAISHSSNSSNSNDSSATVVPQQQPQQQPPSQQQQQQHAPQSQQQSASSTVHMAPTMVPHQHQHQHHHQQQQQQQQHHHPHHHHQQQQHQQQPMVSPSSQLGQHHFPIDSPGQVQHPMTSPISPMHPPPLPQHLNSPSSMGSHHHMNSPSPIMAGVASPPMGGTSMPQQPHPNGLPPHVTTTINIPVMLESINSPLTITGDEMIDQCCHQPSQDLLPDFTTFRNSQGLLSTYGQYTIGFVCGQSPTNLAINVGGLTPSEESIPHERAYETVVANLNTFMESAQRYECMSTLQVQQQPNNDGLIAKQYDANSSQEPPRDCNLESNNNVPYYQGKEEINPNVGVNESPREVQRRKVPTIKQRQITTSEPDYISKDGFHKCLKCNKKFNKACYLTQHNKSFHCGDKPFKCHQCGKRYMSSKEYNNHLDKHAGDKPHKCEVCPKQFNHKTDLRRHKCLHTGEKPYTCSQCFKGFIRKDHMVKHYETHERKKDIRGHNRMLRT